MAFLLSLQITFRWGIVNISQHAYVYLYRNRIAVKSAPVLTRMSHIFSSVVFGLSSCGMPRPDFTTTVNLFFTKSSNNSGEENKLSTYNLWPRPSIFLVSSLTVAWVAVMCFAMRCLSFLNYTFMSYVYPVGSQSLKILMPNLLRFLVCIV